MGCKPSVTPKSIVECDLADSYGESRKDNDDDDENDDNLIATNRGKRQTPTGKGKQQTAKTPRRKVRKQEEETDDLLEFLTTSQEKDRAFFAKLADKEAERIEEPKILLKEEEAHAKTKIGNKAKSGESFFFKNIAKS